MAHRIRFARMAPIRHERARRESRPIRRSGRRNPLFGKRIVKYVTINLPDPIPFAGVEFFPRESMRYHSKIDPAELMRAASAELAKTDPDAFLALFSRSAPDCGAVRLTGCSGGRSTARPGPSMSRSPRSARLKSADSTGAVH